MGISKRDMSWSMTVLNSLNPCLCYTKIAIPVPISKTSRASSVVTVMVDINFRFCLSGLKCSDRLGQERNFGKTITIVQMFR